MSRSALTVLLLTSLALVGAAFADEGAGDDTPRLTVEKAEVDLGDVKAGQDAVAVFVLHNHGREPVKIIRAKPS